ncbi:MAG: hypothetical protein ACRDS1_03930, partial [Pseudonocardiaceae bacterium]
MTTSRPEHVTWETANRDLLVAELTVMRARLRAHARVTAPQDGAADAASDAFPDGVPALADAE